MSKAAGYIIAIGWAFVLIVAIVTVAGLAERGLLP
jgi:hypothetical protein